MTENEASADAQSPSTSKRTRSEPPVIDLAAEEINSGKPLSGTGTDDGLRSSPKINLHWIVAAFAGSLIGGLLVASTLYFIPGTNTASERLIALESMIDQLAPQSSLKTLEARVTKAEADTIETRQSLSQSLKLSPDFVSLTNRLKTLEEVMGHLSDQQTLSDGVLSKSALRLTLAALIKDHVAENAPYKNEYDALIALSGPSAEITPLRNFALTGPISYDLLGHEFIQIVTAPMRADASTSLPSATISDRALDVLSHFVTITPADQVVTNTKSGIAEIQIAIANHQGAKALTLWQSLPEPNRQSLSVWASRLQGRLDVESAADTLVSDTLHTLNVRGAGQ
jgi:hypothetical protein